jgi:hypothetical protein
MPEQRCFGGKAVKMTAETELSMGDRLLFFAGGRPVDNAPSATDDFLTTEYTEYTEIFV